MVLLAAALLGSWRCHQKAGRRNSTSVIAQRPGGCSARYNGASFSEIGQGSSEQAEIKETLQALYRLMAEKETYMAAKEGRLPGSEDAGHPHMSEEQRYDINLRLFNEFKTYIADSASIMRRRTSK